MIDETLATRCGSCGVELEPEEFERGAQCWVHDYAGDCGYRRLCDICSEEEGVEHERDPICTVCVAGAPEIRVFWHAKAVSNDESEEESGDKSTGWQLIDESGAIVPFFDMTNVRRIAIDMARRLMSAEEEAKDWLGCVIEAVTEDGERLMEVPFEFAMPAQDQCEMCTASMGRIAPTNELWTGATAVIWGHAKKGENRDCGNRTICTGCATRANVLRVEIAAAEGLGPDPECERCQARPKGLWLSRITYKLFSEDPWIVSVERLKQQAEEESEGSSDPQKGPWLLR